MAFRADYASGLQWDELGRATGVGPRASAAQRRWARAHSNLWHDAAHQHFTAMAVSAGAVLFVPSLHPMRFSHMGTFHPSVLESSQQSSRLYGTCWCGPHHASPPVALAAFIVYCA